MQFVCFHLMPWPHLPADFEQRHESAWLDLPNTLYDPARGHALYNDYLDQLVAAERLGFDVIGVNEHHQNAYGLMPSPNIMAASLIQRTSRIKILVLGNALPLYDHPQRVAAELAMLDVLSNGRLITGMVVGLGVEAFTYEINPTFIRERYREAHELIVRAWTQEGPFRFEGNHYQHRVVNPWAVPLQKPHPRIWIPGVLSKETIIWAARQRYPYIALSTAIDATKKIWELYDSVAAEAGYTGGPENRGYLQRCHVAETEEKALANARQFMWMQGEFTGLAHPVWSSPSGYFSPSYRKAFVEYAVGRGSNPRAASFEDQIRDQQIIAGTPKTVLPKFRRLLEETRPSILGLWASDGFVSNQDATTCIRLLGQEVLPAVREMGKELGLWSPFEANAPLSITQPAPAVHRNGA
jgi:alkanesulfonate monooxygenase SsuD/methylene tetrahydromethanopterin reductase-like flavin-dependent oxidoreductase (luciferase family)